MLDDAVSIDGRPGLQGQHRQADLAPLVVGDADDGCLGDLGKLVEDVLDLGRIDVLATRDVHVLPAIDDVHEAFLVHARRVAGLQPAALEARRGGFWLVPVAGCDVRPGDPQLADLVGTAVGSVVVDDAHLGVQQRLAGRADLAQRVIGIEGDARRTGLGHPEPLQPSAPRGPPTPP